ncbi:MAG: hypothetical protein U9R60_17395, partial [Bacteroidota bacterium]|nr:hypothetical protein [Bacteroidota bacterium]
MINKFVSGIFKSPRDERDILVRSFFKKERKELPEAFSREDEMTPVRSQGNEGACGGYALSVGVKEWQERKEHKKFIKLSPRFSYEEAKKISG